jgi:hypothetical protein
MKTHTDAERSLAFNTKAALWNDPFTRRLFLRSSGKATAALTIVASGGVLQVLANTSGSVIVGYPRSRTTSYSIEVLKSDLANDETGTLQWASQQLFSSCSNEITNYGPPSLSDYNNKNPSGWSISAEDSSIDNHPTNPNLWVLSWVGPITITKTIRERKP